MTRLRGLLWLTAGIVVAMVAGLVGYNTLNRAVAAPSPQQQGTVPTSKVVVAAHPIEGYTLLRAQDVVLKELPTAGIPANAITELEDVYEQQVTVALYEGEILVASRLVKPNIYSADSPIAGTIAEDQILFALPARDFMSQLNLIKAGDHVDVLFSLEFPEGREITSDPDNTQPATFHTLQNITVAAVSGAPTAAVAEGQAALPAGVLLALTPQDAVTLKFAIDAGGTLDFVLRAPGIDRTFDTQPVDVDYMIDRYGIPIGPGE